MVVDMVRQNPKENEIYRHFKGTLYQIVALAKHSENGEEMVVYRNLFHSSKVYVRPLSMFMSEVDKEKYPEAAQKYRFEKQTKPTEPEVCEAAIRPAEQGECKVSEETEDRVNPLLLQFLDADTYEEKLDLFIGMRDKADEDMVNAIAMSLDLEVDKESLEEKYEEVKNCLITMEKYECNRLR